MRRFLLLCFEFSNVFLVFTLLLPHAANENNDALCKLNALGKVEKQAKDATEALQRQQKEAGDHDQQLALVAATREKAIAEKLMAAGKAMSSRSHCNYFEC